MINVKEGNILNCNEDIIVHQEIWKDIKGYEGLYQISNLGRVKSLPRNGTIKTKRIIKYELDKYGYPQVILNNKKHKCFRVHRLVAEAFILNPQNKSTVNHIDGNKTNNKVSNLEWNTVKENNDHALKTGLQRFTGNKINQFSLDKKFIKKWNSQREIERNLKINHSNLKLACIGKYKQCNGFIWRYAND